MKRLLYLMALGLAVAAIAPVVALADDPLATIKSDITQLQADVQTKHDAVLADAQTLQSDATSLVGSDKSTAKAKIKVDVLKLQGDWKSLLSVCLSDRAKLQSDVAAARAAGLGKGDIRPLVREANLQIRASNLEMRSGVLKARAAVFALRQSFRHAGQTAPSTTDAPRGADHGSARHDVGRHRSSEGARARPAGRAQPRGAGAWCMLYTWGAPTWRSTICSYDV